MEKLLGLREGTALDGGDTTALVDVADRFLGVWTLFTASSNSRIAL
jgi:hypothetical protein